MGKTCCDGTAFVNYQCPQCDHIMHVHRSELPENYEEIELRTVCKKCGAGLLVPQPLKWIGGDTGGDKIIESLEKEFREK